LGKLKKSQVTIYIILGIVIIALLSLLLLFNSRKAETTNEGSQGETFTGGINQQYLNFLIQKCTKEAFIAGEKKYGLNLRTSSSLIETYMENEMPICLNNLKEFEREGFSVDKGTLSVSVKINKDTLIAEVKYPLVMKKGSTTLTFESFSYTFPRLVIQKLNFDKPTHIVSSDGDFVIDVPAGTRAYLNGNEIHEIGIKIVDRNFNDLSNSVLAGSMAFNGWPHGTNFSKPIKITYYYSDRDVPPLIKEENMKIGFYSDDYDFWVGLPTTVDPIKNILTVETTHFSVYGSVVKCGGGTDPLKLIITPSIIREACTPCDDGKWAFDEGNTQKIGQLYHKKDGITVDDKAVTFWDPENDLDAYDCVKPATPADAACAFTPANAITTLPTGEYTPSGGSKQNILKTTKCDCDTRFVFKEFKTPDSTITYGEATSFAGKVTDNDDTITGETPVLPTVHFSEKLEDTENTIIKEKEANTKFIIKLVPEETAINKISTNCEGEDAAKTCEGTIYYTNAKYSGKKLCVCVEQQCAYTKPENLKGRQVYEVQFEKFGNSCFAAAATPSATTGGIVITPPPQVTTQAATQREVAHVSIPVTVNNQQRDPISVDITPLCYDDDDCVVKNAHFITDKNSLEFTVETTNKIKDHKADACILGAAKVEFLGSGLKAEQHLLCTEKALNSYDLVDGKCMQCIKNPNYRPPTTGQAVSPTQAAIPEYTWSGNMNPTQCIYLPYDYCPVSLIGRKDIHNGNCVQCTFCPECVSSGSSDNLGIQGKWLPYSGGCSDCFQPTAAATTTIPACGNGVKETGEDCDGNDGLGDKNCATYKPQVYSAGTISCDSACKVVTGLCTQITTP
jgi:hypothetical protein